MAALLRSVFCSACAGRHMLCFPDDDDVFSNRDYEYDCPSTKRAVRLPKDEWAERAPVCPPGAVILREVKH